MDPLVTDHLHFSIQLLILRTDKAKQPEIQVYEST